MAAIRKKKGFLSRGRYAVGGGRKGDVFLTAGKHRRDHSGRRDDDCPPGEGCGEACSCADSSDNRKRYPAC